MAYYGHIIQCNVLKRLYRDVPSSATFSPIIIRVAALCADNICMETLLIIFAWLLHDEWVVGKLPLMLRRPPHDHDRCLLKVSTKFRGIFHNFLGKNMCTWPLTICLLISHYLLQMFFLNMSCQVNLLSCLIFTLITTILNTVMDRLNMSCQITLSSVV